MADENKGAADIGPAISAELESKVSAGLDSVFSGQDDVVDEPAEQVESPEAAPAAEESASEEPELKGTEAPEAPEAATDEPVEPSKDLKDSAAPAPTLPAAYVRSLKALEWTDDEIADAAKHPNFIATAAKLHASRNKQVSEWAEAGRRARQTQQVAPVKDVTPGQKPSVLGELKPLDAKALKAKYGDDALIDELIGPINEARAQISQMLPLVQQTQQRSQQAELESLGKHIDAFFGSAELKPYAKLYETPEGKNKVLETADALIAGARLQDRNLSLQEALQLAHDSVSSGFKTEAVRSEIKGALKTRERGISLRPSARGANAGGGKVDSHKALERKVGAGLASVFST